MLLRWMLAQSPWKNNTEGSEKTKSETDDSQPQLWVYRQKN